MHRQFEPVFDTVAGILQTFQGREYSAAITPDTCLFADLGLASIDAVVLGETLTNAFQHDFDFQQLLAGLHARGAEDISVGELVGFLEKKLEPGDTGETPPCL